MPDQGPFHTRFRSHSAPSPASPLPPPPSPPREHDRPPDSSFSRHQALPRASPISLPPPPPGLPACQNPRLGKRDMDTAISALFLSAACLNLPSVFSILHLAPPCGECVRVMTFLPIFHRPTTRWHRIQKPLSPLLPLRSFPSYLSVSGSDESVEATNWYPPSFSIIISTDLSKDGSNGEEQKCTARSSCESRESAWIS